MRRGNVHLAPDIIFKYNASQPTDTFYRISGYSGL